MLDRVIRFGGARVKARARRLAIRCAVVASLALLASGAILQGQEADALRARLQARLSELQAKSGVPGGTAAVVLPDGRSFELAAGTTDIKQKIPMQPGVLFMAGSTGKTFVAAIIMQLVAENRIQFDDHISKWLGRNDWFSRLPNGHDITVRMLLNHTSGIPDHVVNHKFIDAVFASPDRVWKPEELVGYILDAKPQSPAGVAFHYTDTNYVLLGMIIESVTGSSYYSELDRRILQPLGLRHTVPNNQRRIPGLVQGHSGGAKRSWYEYGDEKLDANPEPGSAAAADAMLVDGEFVVNPQFEWTGGGLAMTSEDLARWAKVVYEGRVFPQALLDEALKAPARSTNGHGYYGLGVGVSSTEFGPRYGHGGYFPGYGATMAYFPQSKVAIAVLINSSAPGVHSFSQQFVVDAMRMITENRAHLSK
jgi:D-alanyl-D-alanine carboxypeptidase